MLTYLLLDNETQAKGNHSCPAQRCFKEFTSHQLDLSRPTEHMNTALIRSEAHIRRRTTNLQATTTKFDNTSSVQKRFVAKEGDFLDIDH